MTTIKVTRSLRDRIATTARTQHLTFGEAIARALDTAESREFWHSVERSMRERTTSNAPPDGTVRDNLDDEADRVIAERGEW